MSIELLEEDILNIIKNGLKYLVENEEITNAKSLLIKNLIKLEKIKIILEKIGDPIRIEKFGSKAVINSIENVFPMFRIPFHIR